MSQWSRYQQVARSTVRAFAAYVTPKCATPNVNTLHIAYRALSKSPRPGIARSRPGQLPCRYAAVCVVGRPPAAPGHPPWIVCPKQSPLGERRFTASPSCICRSRHMYCYPKTITWGGRQFYRFPISQIARTGRRCRWKQLPDMEARFVASRSCKCHAHPGIVSAIRANMCVSVCVFPLPTRAPVGPATVSMLDPPGSRTTSATLTPP